MGKSPPSELIAHKLLLWGIDLAKYKRSIVVVVVVLSFCSYLNGAL